MSEEQRSGGVVDEQWNIQWRRGQGRRKRKVKEKKDELRGILVILHLSDKPRGISVTSCELLPSH
jgi:hypothetical protein